MEKTTKCPVTVEVTGSKNPVRLTKAFVNPTGSKKSGVGMQCKECGKRIPTSKSTISWHCQVLGYCRYCYRMNYPKRHGNRLPPSEHGSEQALSWSKRRRLERGGFNTAEWSPGFRDEMWDYWEAKERGEVRI